MIIFFFVGAFAAQAQISSSVPIITRSQWGADETWRSCQTYDRSKRQCAETGPETWPLEYAPVKKIIIHETASDSITEVGSIQGLRNLYFGHAISRNWGDIGYNYLIDTQGNIYEGRFGGDGVIAGHTFYIYKDKQTGAEFGFNFNSGSIGVAVLGSFSNGAITSAIEDALNRILTAKTLAFGFNPRGRDLWPVPISLRNDEAKALSGSVLLEALERAAVLFRVKGVQYRFEIFDPAKPVVILNEVENAIVHRDIDYTLDPPESLFQAFARARVLAQANWQGQMSVGLAQRATKLGQSAQEVTVRAGETAQAWVEYRNDGETTWHGFTDDRLTLISQEQANRLAQLGQLQIAGLTDSVSYDGITVTMEPKNVAPGETARLTFRVAPSGTAAQEQKNYVLAARGRGWFADSEFSMTVNALGLSYAAQLAEITTPDGLSPQAAGELVVKFKNTGTQIWRKENFRLNVKEASGETSVFQTKDWQEIEGGFMMQEAEVANGQTASFRVPLSAPKLVGDFPELLDLQQVVSVPGSAITRLERVEGGLASAVIHVVSPYQARIIEHTIPVAVKMQWRPRVKITLENIGAAAWEKGTALEIYELKNNKEIPSGFWWNTWAGRNTPVKLAKKVLPGEKIILSFIFDPPDKRGVYELVYRLKEKNEIIYLSGSERFKRLLRVD